RVWPDTFVEESALAKNVSLLRKTLGGEENAYIETVPKRGYRFVAEVRRVESDSRGPSAVTREMAAEHAPVRRAQRVFVGIGLAIVLSGAGLAAWQWLRPRATPPARKIMLAVLPFENLSGDAEQEYLSDGLTEEMITQLARLNPEHMAVIARTSSMHFKTSKKTVAEIGQELGVDYVLEGSVRSDGERLRISAQLIQVEDQTHLWAESYERDVRDILAVQDEVARAIATGIRIQLTPQGLAAAGRGSSARAAAPEVYQLYLKGRYFWNKRTPEGFSKSIELFEQAIAKDPRFALAYAGLADSYVLLGPNNVRPPSEVYPKVKAAAQKALELDETLAEAHASLAFAKLLYDWDPRGAEQEFLRAIADNPSYPTARHWYAYTLAALGKLEMAVAEIRRAQALDPLSLSISSDVGQILLFARRYDEAIEQCKKTLEMDPEYRAAYWYLGLTYEQKGMHDEAVGALLKQVSLRADSAATQEQLKKAYAAGGMKGYWRTWAARWEEPSRRKEIPSFSLAVVYARAGEREKAIHMLQKAHAEHFPSLVFLPVEPVFDPLRSHPQFQDLVKRISSPAT
ncbi:MAG TPA: tetratricopeptide repeat protein, partial [Candidatus Acidoferrales bacterium]|nr:tetratricopeptide repeat protein [Candidatus Acidoferrales bacterium]